MEVLNQWALPILIVWPLLCAILVFMSKSDRLIKWGAVAASLLPLGISIYMLVSYDYKTGGMAFEVNWPWIPAINASIHLGVDNLSIPFVFLTALLTTLSLYYSIFVINAALFWFVAQVVKGFSVDGFLAALVGSLLYSLVTLVVSWVLPGRRK